MVGKFLLILLGCTQIFPSFRSDDSSDVYSSFNETNTWSENPDFVTENIIYEKDINSSETSNVNEKVASMGKESLQDNSVNDVHFMHENLNVSNLIAYAAVIEDLNITSVTYNSLIISWKVTGDNVSSYTIQWFKDLMHIHQVNGVFPDLKYKIDKLDPSTKYQIQVEPKVTNRLGKSKSIIVTTKIQPGAPSIISVVPDKFEGMLALKIAWEPSEVGLSFVKHYRVNLDTEFNGVEHHVSKSTNKSFIIIEHLLACASYLVTVRAVDVDGEDGLPSTFQSPPTLSKGTIPPKLVNSMNVPAVISTATKITMNWKVLDVRNNCSIESVHTECNYSYSEGYGVEVREVGMANYTTNGRHVNLVRLTVEDLSPASRYVCFGWTINEGGRSFPGMPVPVFTKESVPSPPQNFRIIDALNKTFAWDPSRIMPGRLQKYRITFWWEPLYPVPYGCNFSHDTKIINISATHLNYTWDGGEGYSRYIAFIEARTGAGWSVWSNQIEFLSSTKGVSDEVRNLKQVTKPVKNNSNVLETKLQWNLPCSLKGQLKHFEIFVHGVNRDPTNHSFNTQLIPGHSIGENELFSINLGELKPQYTYMFEVSAMISETNKKGAPARCFFEYPAGIPPQPAADYLKSITLQPNKIRRTTTSFEILLPLFPNDNGEVEYYAIIVSRLGRDYKPAHTRFDLKTDIWPNVSSWRDSMEHDFEIPYQASEPHWTPYPNYILDYGSIKAVKFVVGDDNTCRDVSLATKRRLYCNGPLKPGTWYAVRMRAFTNGGYADAPAVAIRTNAETSIILIVGIVFGILLLGTLVSLMVAGKLHFKRKQKKNSKSGENSGQERGRARRGTMTGQSRAYDPAMRTRRR